MRKYEDLVVDGETEDNKGRQVVAGLRLLRHYGRLADKALRHIEAGGDVRALVPFLERVGEKGRSRGHYSISPVAVHSDVTVPPLPDYSKLTVRLEKIQVPKSNFVRNVTKRQEDQEARGFTVHVVGSALGVYPKGEVLDVLLKKNEDIVASVWLTKSRVSWAFRNMSDVKGGKARVVKSLSESLSKIIVRLCSDGTREVWHSQASRVHAVLRSRCAARLELDGHAERIRQEVEATLVVNDIHAL